MTTFDEWLEITPAPLAHLLGLLPMPDDFTKGEIIKVGPHGYIHGWIFVGVPAENDRVNNPQHGTGRVSRVRHLGNGKHGVSVKFDSGHYETFDAHEVASGSKPRFTPDNVPVVPTPNATPIPSEDVKPRATEPKDARHIVGIPDVGKRVSHPIVGDGTITSVSGSSAHVKFDDGSEQDYGVHFAPGETRFERGPAPEHKPEVKPNKPIEYTTRSINQPATDRESHILGGNPIPNVDQVRHPVYGPGMVTSNEYGVATVKFHNGQTKHFTVKPNETGPGRFEPNGEYDANADVVPKTEAPKVTPSTEPDARAVRGAELDEIEAKSYSDAMASGKTSRQHLDEADQANRDGRQAYSFHGTESVSGLSRSQMYSNKKSEEKGLRRAAGDKARVEADLQSSALPATGTRQLTQDQAYNHLASQMLKSNTDASVAAREAHRISSTHETHVLPDGSMIHFNNSTKVAPAKKTAALAELQSLRQEYPDKPATQVFAGSSQQKYDGTMKRFGKGVRGYAYMGKPTIWVAPTTLKTPEEAQFKRAVDLGYFMPAGQGKDPVAYVIAHEYGHTIDVPRGVTRKESTSRHLRANVETSRYGGTSTAETMAEAFAEWHLSHGQTTNQTVRNIAESEGWKK